MKVSIEYGHIYTDDGLHTRGMPFPGADISRDLDNFEKSCLVAGQNAAEIAIGMGLDVKTHVLIDDVEWAHRQGQALHGEDSGRWIIFRQRVKEAATKAYSPDELFSEADLVKNGVSIQGQIRSKAGKDLASHMKLDTKKGPQRIRLQGFKGVDDEKHPSCDVLDLAWHKKRGEDAEILLTVLHENYSDQQARVHALAEFLATEPLNSISVATLFLDNEGNPAVLERWSERGAKAKEYFDKIEKQFLETKQDD